MEPVFMGDFADSEYYDETPEFLGFTDDTIDPELSPSKYFSSLMEEKEALGDYQPLPKLPSIDEGIPEIHYETQEISSISPGVWEPATDNDEVDFDLENNESSSSHYPPLGELMMQSKPYPMEGKQYDQYASIQDYGKNVTAGLNQGLLLNTGTGYLPFSSNMIDASTPQPTSDTRPKPKTRSSRPKQASVFHPNNYHSSSTFPNHTLHTSTHPHNTLPTSTYLNHAQPTSTYPMNSYSNINAWMPTAYQPLANPTSHPTSGFSNQAPSLVHTQPSRQTTQNMRPYHTVVPALMGEMISGDRKTRPLEKSHYDNFYGKLRTEILARWGPKGVFAYESTGDLTAGQNYTDDQLRYYINNCPRDLRLWVQHSPAQVKLRVTDASTRCRWEDCPVKLRKISSGQLRVAIEEFPVEVDQGIHNPFRITGALHLFCFEQIFDPLVYYSRGLLRPDNRNFKREMKNPMALTRDLDAKIVEETFNPWIASARPSSIRPFEETLTRALVHHHLRVQPETRKKSRAERRANQQGENSCSIDQHFGNLVIFARRKGCFHSRFRDWLNRTHSVIPNSPPNGGFSSGNAQAVVAPVENQGFAQDAQNLLPLVQAAGNSSGYAAVPNTQGNSNQGFTSDGAHSYTGNQTFTAMNDMLEFPDLANMDSNVVSSGLQASAPQFTYQSSSQLPQVSLSDSDFPGHFTRSKRQQQLQQFPQPQQGQPGGRKRGREDDTDEFDSEPPRRRCRSQ